MAFTSLKIRGSDAIRSLEELRYRFTTTGEYPFLIGDADELERIKELPDFNLGTSSSLIHASAEIRIEDWIAKKRKEADEDELSPEEFLGEWPGEILEKGSIRIHKDIGTDEFLPDVYIGLAKLEQPWQLPAVLRYGAWNDCPHPEVHAAFHRRWQERYGAEIVSMSGDVVECTVRNPPRDQAAAMALAMDQYWYCMDIVHQGCESVSNLAATLMNSDYWFFWWD